MLQLFPVSIKIQHWNFEILWDQCHSSVSWGVSLSVIQLALFGASPEGGIYSSPISPPWSCWLLRVLNWVNWELNKSQFVINKTPPVSQPGTEIWINIPTMLQYFSILTNKKKHAIIYCSLVFLQLLVGKMCQYTKEIPPNNVCLYFVKLIQLRYAKLAISKNLRQVLWFLS